MFELKHLTLTYCERLEEAQLKQIAALNLVSLKLIGTQISQLEPIASCSLNYLSLQVLKNIHSLNLNFTCLTLESLNFYDCDLSYVEEGKTLMFSQFSKMPNLKRFSAKNCHLTQIDDISSLKGLVELDLRGN